MELKISRVGYNNAETFFSGFYSESAVLQNGYKLRRLLDFGQAVVGDYLVCQDQEGKSLLSLEIVRSSSFRFWEGRIKRVADLSPELLKEILDTLLEYLSENRIIIVPYLPLIFVCDISDELDSILVNLLNEKKYPLITTNVEFFLTKIEPQSVNKESDIVITQFVNLPLEERMNIVDKFDLYSGNGVKIEKLYQDYIEFAEVAEVLWQGVIKDGEVLGYFMIAKKDLLTNPMIELYNYTFASSLTITQKENLFKQIFEYIRDLSATIEGVRVKISLHQEDIEVVKSLVPVKNEVEKQIYLERVLYV